MEGMDKKTAINQIIEKGKAACKLSSNEIDSLIIEYDFDIEELDKLYELVEPPQFAPGIMASTMSMRGSSSTLNFCATK